MNVKSFLIMGLFVLVGIGYPQTVSKKVMKDKHTIYDFVVKDIDGKNVQLSEYKGKVMLIVNVASKCGFTPQYEGLQKIYSQFADQGFVVLAFPANNFRNQEPGNNSEIKEFCTVNYGVSFPLFSKISVKGEDIHPLYEYLTSEKTNRKFAGEITWNFNKFLVNPVGELIARFESKVKPEDEKIITAITKTLK